MVIKTFIIEFFYQKNLIEDTLHPIEINFIGILGKGIQNKLQTRSFDNQYINKNLLYFLSNIKDK